MYSGRRISEIIAAGPLATDPLLAVGTALADLVATAHARQEPFGLIGPATVFLTDDGRVLLLDPAAAPVSARKTDDLRALAALLYGLATGIYPYTRSTSPPAAAPRSPIELNPRLPSGLVRLIQRGVDPDAGRRTPAAEEIREALHEIRRAPGSLESLLPAEHVSSSAAVKPPPRPPADERDEDTPEGPQPTDGPAPLGESNGPGELDALDEPEEDASPPRGRLPFGD